MKRSGILGLAVLFVAMGLAHSLRIGSTARAAWAAPAFLITATEQTERGKELFAQNCAKCHGEQGQGGEDPRGGTVPRLIGTPNGLQGYMTAKGLFDFVSKEMPGDEPGTLMPQIYWDILAFILDSNRLLPPNVTLGPENAANIRLSPVEGSPP